jgi:A/G-specific adenine glycosylase
VKRRSARICADDSELSRLLLTWYRSSRRRLPWRENPTAYRVWVSEVMLQQTRVATVIPYFERWMQRFPTVAALAAADEGEVLRVWQGLGYYSRARALLRGAREVVDHHGGEVPSGVDELLGLPGVGPYSAGAIASIAFGRRVPVVDGNVNRVLCRVFGLRGDPQRAPLKARIWKLAGELVPPDAPGEHNQAVMELGATVCAPRSPVCLTCPLAGACVARRDGLIERLPELAARPQAVPIDMVATVVWRRGRLLLVRPTRSRWWSGLWQLPSGEIGPSERGDQAARRVVREAAALEVGAVQERVTLRHTVTRFRVALHAWEARRAAGRLRSGPGWTLAWLCPEQLAEVGMPAPHRRLVARLLE